MSQEDRKYEQLAAAEERSARIERCNAEDGSGLVRALFIIAAELCRLNLTGLRILHKLEERL